MRRQKAIHDRHDDMAGRDVSAMPGAGRVRQQRESVSVGLPAGSRALVCGLSVAVWLGRRVAVGVMFVLGGAAAHHLEHGGAAGAEEPYEQSGGDQQEDDVEDGGVVPGDAGVGDFGSPPAGTSPRPPKANSMM